MKKIISYDFGTGGIKASLYTSDGEAEASAFVAYSTEYPHMGWHEQRPDDWWKAFCLSTGRLMAESAVKKNDIECLAISGHSLGVVPLDKNGCLLRRTVPIWSDGRAKAEADAFFRTHDYTQWYYETGNGFPAHLYSAFKLMWYRNHEPEMFSKIHMILGTKDYINYLLTGSYATDQSYASGSGFYNLTAGEYDLNLMRQMDLPSDIFPKIVPSTAIIGTVSEKAAEQTGLSSDVKVICGGVDNACMALGSRGIKDGRAYTSLGSSAWIAITGSKPILSADSYPYVFAHVIPGMYASALASFSAGSSFQWVCDQICKNLKSDPDANPFTLMDQLAASSPAGSHKLLFNPSLAGGSGSDKTPNIRGAYIGLDLKHTQADLIRSAMEGIALSLRSALECLRSISSVSNEMLFVGGGANSRLWLQIFANIYGMDIFKTNVGQNAGSLGAAAVAAVGCGMWKDFTPIDEIHQKEYILYPEYKEQAVYNKLYAFYLEMNEHLYQLSDKLHGLEIEE